MAVGNLRAAAGPRDAVLTVGADVADGEFAGEPAVGELVAARHDAPPLGSGAYSSQTSTLPPPTGTNTLPDLM